MVVIVYDNIIISHVIIIDNIIMTYKKRFRKTKNNRSFRENTTRKKKRMHKTTLKKGGTATGTRIFNMLQRKGIDIKDPAKQDEILKEIDDFIKTNNIHAQDTGIIGRKTNALMSSVTGGVDGAIEVIGKWLIPGKPSSGKKNMSEITVYFFPSLVKSKPGDNNKPKLRHGSIMVKTNHQYADISNYVRSMTRDTDDMLAEMVRGVAYPLGRKPYHKERFRISERLDSDWKYTPKGDAASSVITDESKNKLTSELEAKKKELDQTKKLQEANKESYEKSKKELEDKLAEVNKDLKNNKENEAKIQELEKEKENIEKELDTAKKGLTLESNNSKNTKLEAKIFRSENDKLKNEKTILEAELKKLQAEKNNLQKGKGVAVKKTAKETAEKIKREGEQSSEELNQALLSNKQKTKDILQQNRRKEAEKRKEAAAKKEKEAAAKKEKEAAEAAKKEKEKELQLLKEKRKAAKKKHIKARVNDKNHAILVQNKKDKIANYVKMQETARSDDEISHYGKMGVDNRGKRK